MGKKQTESIAVGMSGGVDSSAALAFLLESGHSVIGVTAKLTTEYSRCCSDADTEAARQVCDALGVEHFVVDVRDSFDSEVIKYFMSEYIHGRTPSPCAVCNQMIKFGVLLDKALELGADAFATGHYVRVLPSEDNMLALMRGRDLSKDQSYFLSRLNQKQLSKARFPLGDMTKRMVYDYVKSRGVVTKAPKESQEICFVTEGNHGSWIDVRSFDSPGQGDIVDRDGNVLGKHNGVHHYTIGQRKGLGLAVGHPVYITEIDAERNIVVVGEKEEAFSQKARLSGVSWISGKKPSSTFNCRTQIRYNHSAAESTVLVDGDLCVVNFDEPQFAVTPGQLAVFYEESAVLGSAWIDAVES